MTGLTPKENLRFQTLLKKHFNTIMACAETEIMSYPSPDQEQQKELQELFILWNKLKKVK